MPSDESLPSLFPESLQNQSTAPELRSRESDLRPKSSASSAPSSSPQGQNSGPQRTAEATPQPSLTLPPGCAQHPPYCQPPYPAPNTWEWTKVRDHVLRMLSQAQAKSGCRFSDAERADGVAALRIAGFGVFDMSEAAAAARAAYQALPVPPASALGR